MRRFFAELSAALLLAAAMAACLEWLYRDYRTFVDRRLAGLEAVSAQLDGLIVGGSHTGALGILGLTDGDRVYNTSIGGQDLRRSFLLTQALLPRMPRLSYVIVQLDYDNMGYNLASGGQDWMDRQYFPYTHALDHDGLLPRLLARSSFVRANRDLAYLLAGAPPSVSHDAAALAAPGLIPVESASRRHGDLDACRLRALEHSRVKFFPALVPNNVQLLEAFSELARQRQIRVIFVDTPKAACYVNAYEPSTRILGRDAIAAAATRWNLQFVDLFGGTGFDDTEDFVDWDHLSHAGANKVMARIRDVDRR